MFCTSDTPDKGHDPLEAHLHKPLGKGVGKAKTLTRVWLPLTVQGNFSINRASVLLKTRASPMQDQHSPCLLRNFISVQPYLPDLEEDPPLPTHPIALYILNGLQYRLATPPSNPRPNHCCWHTREKC